VIAGVSALAAHTARADQFHWIGWYNVAIGGALLFVLIALFRGECEWKKPEMNCTTLTTKCCNVKSNKTQALTGSVVNIEVVNFHVCIVTSSSCTCIAVIVFHSKISLSDGNRLLQH